MNVDANGNGEIEISEAEAVYYLDVQGVSSGVDFPTDLSDLTGIEYFTNLVELNCADNVLTSLDVSELTNLISFRCDRNNLTSLNISGIHNLKIFYYGGNYLPNVDFQTNTQLIDLGCDNNQIYDLDISALVNLEFLMCDNNFISELNLTQNRRLKSLFCTNNTLTNLDLSQMSGYVSFHASNNPLVNLNMKHGKFMNSNSLSVYNTDLANIPNLKYVCVDEKNLTAFQTKLNSYGYSNCNLNTYCSFFPGGQYFTVQGTAKFDASGNGCDSGDLHFPGVKYSIVSGAVQSSVLADINSGYYSATLQGGTHTITPVLENPNYYTILPASIVVNLPSEINPMTQNFCITSNGVFKDLEITLIPIDVPRPGFDAHYKVIFKNKGTVAVSGTIEFLFMEEMMNFVASIPATNSATGGILQYTYSNLQSLETREIVITFNINSSIEPTPVLNGTNLKFSTVIFPVEDDVHSTDNYSSVIQTVIDSTNPSDKRCLEGDTITQEMVGDYIHYMIRFENTGSANAQNIVVADLIDLSKFDISSLVTLSSSHMVSTRILNVNKVEFIFENIQLPYDDANNDGYVVFKIKTLPTLTVGDSFSNTANIYFDYNFPIITNTATTNIAVLGISEFEFSDYFSVYPNPAETVLNINSKKGIKTKSLEVYSIFGQLLHQVSDDSGINAVDVSDLATGNYFLKTNTEKGSSVMKFIKK